MGFFSWLASRWTPEFEYRDRLADEVEDIAFESTRIGTRRGFLMGVLFGAVIAGVGFAAMVGKGIEIPFLTAAELPRIQQEVRASQFPPESLSLLKQENDQLRRELADARAAAISSREKVGPEHPPIPITPDLAQPEPRKEPAPRPKTADVSVPAEKRAAAPPPPLAKTDRPAPRPAKTARETAARQEVKGTVLDSLAPQPIPSNCRREGDCDPVAQ